MTPVALRGRGTTSTYNCFPATGLYFKSKVLASVGRGSTETTRLQHGSSMFGDTHAKWGGGGGDLAASMATWLSSSLRNENGKLKIFVVRTTLLAKSHRCWIVGTCEPTRCLKPLWRRKREQDELMIEREKAWTIFCPFQVEDTRPDVSWFHKTRLHFPFCFFFLV